MNNRLTMIIGGVSLIALGACAPAGQQGATGPGGLNRAQQGAIAGAVVGGIYGATRDNDKNNQGADAVKGAIAGAAAGAIGGSILDRQEAALRQSVNNPNIQIVNHGNYLQVVLPSGLLFASDSAAVSGAAQNDLYAVAQNLNEYPNSRIQVVGHTDNTASAQYNMDLSQRRAQSVAGILTAAGVNSGRVQTVGRGEDQPVASNTTDAGKAQNRRVEILIYPNQ